MKKFKEFLENYDVYIETPQETKTEWKAQNKKKKAIPASALNISTADTTAQEEIANNVTGM
jgi:hypothetical protein